MARHILTPEERQRGGKTRASQDSFREHCANAYEILKFKRPDVAMKILEKKIRPYYSGSAERQQRAYCNS